MRIALFIAAPIVTLLTFACGADDEGGDAAAPVATDGWQTFEAATGCLSISYPVDWDATARESLVSGGGEDCPGGPEKVSEIVACTFDAVNNGDSILTVESPGGGAARVELVANATRCPTISEHVNELLAGFTELDTRDGYDVLAGDPTDEEVSGFAAKCIALTRSQPDKPETDGKLCVVEVASSIYHFWADWETSRSDDFKATVGEIAATLVISPIED